MPLSTDAKNAMLDNEATRMLFASLHSSYPGDTGANEIAGGVPPYARQPIAWNAAAAGELDNNLNPTFNVPPATTVAWLGFWTLVAGGVYQGCVPLGGQSSRPFVVSDDASDTLHCDSHGYSLDQKVVVYDTHLGVLPGGLVEGTIYFVTNPTADTLQLSATEGGAAINLSTDGAGFIQNIVPEVFGGQGTYTTSDVDWSLNR